MEAPIKITLYKTPTREEAHVILEVPDGGSEDNWFPLIWLNDEEWNAVFWSLELYSKDSTTWPTSPDISTAEKLYLFSDGQPSDQRWEIIGNALYKAIFSSKEIEGLFSDSLRRRYEDIPVVQLRMSSKGSILHSYPWELLHNGKDFLFDARHAFLVRYLDIIEPIKVIEKKSLKVLLIDPRPRMPQDYPNLSLSDRPHLKRMSNQFPGEFVVTNLSDVSESKHTLSKIQRYLMTSQDDIHTLHIDTHGDFGWLCKKCRRTYRILNSPRAKTCKTCEVKRPEKQEVQGYLAFQDETGKCIWVDGKQLGKVLMKRGIQVVVLSACKSGLVGGSSAFNSVAGALIRQGIPSVIAMQFSVDERAAKTFIDTFYRALIAGTPLTGAVAEARINLRTILDNEAWYRPVLYLRTDRYNYQGEVFENVGDQMVDTILEERSPKQRQLAKLRQLLTNRYNEDELRMCCFEFDVNYDNDLLGEGKTNKARDFVMHLERHGRIPELVALYPDLTLNVSLGSTPEATGDIPSTFQRTPKPEFKKTSPISNLQIEPPYKTMLPDSKFYIKRATDDECWEYIISGTEANITFIQAPKKMGKSTLMRRVIDRANRYGKKSAFVDFRKFPKRYLQDEKDFFIEFCCAISDALEIPEEIDQYWSGRRANSVKCSRYLSEYVILKFNEPFILAMDEVEHVLNSPFCADFLGVLRGWHNSRPDENFANMTLFLSSSIEPDPLEHYSFRSVIKLISLDDFSRAEVEKLNRRHNSPLSQNQVDDLMYLVSGHPFLTRLALYLLATGKIDLDTLLVQATEDTGPFDDHLRHYLLRVLQKPELKQALTQICREHTHEENQVFHRLKGAGLIKKEGKRVVLRNLLYTLYFEERLDV